VRSRAAHDKSGDVPLAVWKRGVAAKASSLILSGRRDDGDWLAAAVLRRWKPRGEVPRAQGQRPGFVGSWATLRSH
jgi:hypothetical protein